MTNRERMELFYANAAAGDHEAVNAMIHPDFVGYEADGLPYAGVYKGLEGWHHLCATVYGTWEKFTPKLQYILGDPEDRIFAAMLETSATVPGTGEKIETYILEQWVFKDGLICEVRPFYWDTALLRDAVARAKR